MNEIQQYYKATAEALGFTLSKGKYYGSKNHAFILEKDWHPDTDYNQMGMIIKHLQSKGYDVEIEWHQDGVDATIDKPGLEFVNDLWQYCDEDVALIAFMKAFMEYVESIKQER